jgi:hypothetical protein
MAAIYLRHPVHGTKVACSDFEANQDMRDGWVEFTPGVPSVEEPDDLPQDPVNSLVSEPRRRGRPRKE